MCDCQRTYHIEYGMSISDVARDCEHCGDTLCNECLDGDEHFCDEALPAELTEPESDP